ncbi:DUF6221 family protein [Streptomyces sp. CAU 1734]|uniref:DUF6221 family protein n=1 Tax=Streptomyces sp. CAU 1734 TaxID=3140360 RepID=UPI0032608574
MCEIAEFLRARYEDEWNLARDAGGTDWVFSPTMVWNGPGNITRQAVVEFMGTAMAYIAALDPVHGKYGVHAGVHIALHDPRRVGRESDMKLRILDVHFPRTDAQDPKRVECGQCSDSYPCVTLRLMAQPYAGHACYRKEWRP